jgi:hypothetical protein
MDRDLILDARDGNQDAFGVLVEGSIDRCYALAFRILRDVELSRDAALASSRRSSRMTTTADAMRSLR